MIEVRCVNTMLVPADGYIQDEIEFSPEPSLELSLDFDI